MQGKNQTCAAWCFFCEKIELIWTKQWGEKMNKVVALAKPFRYVVYKHRTATTEGRDMEVYLIVLTQSERCGIFRFTGLEFFAGPYRTKPVNYVPKEQELHYICKALNYIMFDCWAKYRVTRVTEITQSMIFEFFDAYRTSPKDRCGESYRGQQSIDKCVSAVSYFFANMSKAVGVSCAVRPEDLLRRTFFKHGKSGRKEYECYFPAWKGTAEHGAEKKLLRDIPESVMQELLIQAKIHDPMLYFALVCGITAGTRASETMNLRRTDSPLSMVPGIKLRLRGSAVEEVRLDLTREFMLRSDGVIVGRIKKERVVDIYKPFIPEFIEAYHFHMGLIRAAPYEKDYAPMFLIQNGKAMTGDTFRKRFQILTSKYLRPALLKSDLPEHQAYGMMLQSHNLSPHALRHYFTVRLVLAGLGVPELMYYRGDKSNESALTYLQNKGEIMRKLEETHSKAIESLLKNT